MAKKIEPVAKALAAAPGLAVPPAKSQTQLKGIRDKIDKLDQQIIKLINERASHAGEIGRLKTESGEDVFSPAREEQVLKQVLDLHQQTGGPLDNTTVRAIFREIMSGSRALQKVLNRAIPDVPEADKEKKTSSGRRWVGGGGSSTPPLTR